VKMKSPRSLVPEGIRLWYHNGVGRPRRTGYARCSDAVPFHPLAVTISRSTATAVRPIVGGTVRRKFARWRLVALYYILRPVTQLNT
jgi:hypothetical protein